ncbi:MAG: hypothetical protein AB2L20_28990 [Mangrovibacterium sp.]
MEVLGYQTLEDKNNIDEIEVNGPFKCTRSEAWLGEGYYLWDSEIEWAMQWGLNCYAKNGKDFVIGRCSLLIDERCFDLFGNVSHLIEFRNIVTYLIEGKFVDAERITVPKVIGYLKKKGIFDYESIRAADYPREPNKLAFRVKYVHGKLTIKEYMLINPRVQICVINKKNVILTPFLVIYPEKYLI